MSNLTDKTELSCDFERTTCDAINLVITPKDRDLGGFCVRRLLPNIRLRSIGPWVFFDHMGPAVFEPNQVFEVRPHPHIGIATVTYLFAGEIFHRDSLGTAQPIRPGAINLMVTGSGMVHSERQTPELQTQRRELHGLQLWLALPEADQETAPAFYHYPANDIPAVTVSGVKVRVLMGQAYGVASPVKTYSETLYVEAFLEAGQELELPQVAELGLYVVSGNLMARETEIAAQNMVSFSPTAHSIVVKATENTQIALIGGATLGPRYMDWNFVSTDKARIERAKSDWQAGRFPKVPGDEDAFIPLP